MRKRFLRWWYKKFHKERTFKLQFAHGVKFEYGDIVLGSDGSQYMSLGNHWFLLLKNQKR